MATALSLQELKEGLFKSLELRLGGGMVDIELDPAHYEASYQYALKVYRQRAQNSTVESYTLMELSAHVNTYTLPDEFVGVRQVFRRTIGLETGPSSSSFDPFSSAILNTYLLNYNHAGGLATYDFYAGYIELAARMFGGYVIYTFNPVTKQIKLVRDVKATGEKILIWGDLVRPEIELLQDPGAGVWIGDFTFANLKLTLGEAREKYASLAGPGGGTTLNGTALKAEGLAMETQLIDELKRYVDHSQPMTWIIG
jgi:hypothetical protein